MKTLKKLPLVILIYPEKLVDSHNYKVFNINQKDLPLKLQAQQRENKIDL